MAVILPPRRVNFGLREANPSEAIRHSLKLDLSSKLAAGKLVLFGTTEDYLTGGPLHGLNRVELRDAQVPDFCESSSILDLSTPTLDTPSIIDSIVDEELPFRFSGAAPDPAAPPPADIVSEAAASAMLGIEDNHETFQDLTGLITDSPMPMTSSSPAPLLSPTGSVYSDVTAVSSPASLLSAASTSSDTHFFAPDFEEIGAPSSVKSEPRDNRYVEMRRRNNLASRRSRQTRREKEREMEQQLKQLMDENASLRTKAKTLDELVNKAKGILMDAFSRSRMA